MINIKILARYALQPLALSFLLFITGCQSDDTTDSESDNADKIGSHEASPEKSKVDLPSIGDFNTDVAFVPSISEGTISAIDLTNNRVKWTLKVSEGNEERGPESAMGIAATADGKWIFTGDVANNEVVIVDADNQKIVKRIPLSHGIHAIDISPHDHSVWVSGILPDYPWLTAVSVIDVAKQEKVTTLSPGLGGSAHYAWTPDGKEIWAASVTTNTVWVWDAVNREVLDVIPLIYEDLTAESPEASFGLIGLNEIAITPDGKTAFAVGPEAGVVFAIDVRKRKMINAVKVGERTHGISVSRDGKEVWTANNSGTVTILDVGTLTVLDQIDLTEYADELPYAHIAFSLDGAKAYVSMAQDLVVIDVAARSVATTISFGYGTHEISLEDFYVEYSNIERTESATIDTEGENNTQEDILTQTSKKAGITISVTYQKEVSDKISFEISMDTHAGDIMVHNLTEQSVVVLDGSDKITTGLSWEPISESSHHRKGILTLDQPNQNFNSIELIIKDVGVDKRTFNWNNIQS